MRIVWAAVIWVVFAGGLMIYMLQRGSAAQTPANEIFVETAKGVYTLVVTTTFAAQPDPFALTAGDEAPAALQIRMGSRVQCDADYAGCIPGIQTATGFM